MRVLASLGGAWYCDLNSPPNGEFMRLSMDYTKPIEVRDSRSKTMYRIDDAYLNGYAKLCGLAATAVYNSLCRHADNQQESYPSIDLMAVQHNISRPTVIKAIKALQTWGIIIVVKSKNDKTKRQNVNVYQLVDKAYWKPKPSKPYLPGAESILEADPSQSDVKSRVNDVDWKEAQSKDTQRRIAETSSAPVFMMQDAIDKMEKSNRRDLNIIAFYITEKKLEFKKRAQLVVAVKRHLRAAKLLSDFEDEQIVKATKQAKHEYAKLWTIETLVKILTR